MRVLYVMDHYRPKIDGVVISIERQALGLASRGHEVAIIAPGQRFANYEETEGGLRVFRVRAVRVLLDTWRLAILPRKAIEDIVASFAPDVIVINLPMPLNQTAARLARKYDVPLVGITGTMPEWIIYSFGILKPFSKILYSKLWDMLTGYYNNCDVVVGVTPTALHYLQEHGLSKPSRVISNGVHLDKFCERERDEELALRLNAPDKLTVLYTGRLDAEKCMDVWVKAIPTVLAETDAHFIIGGEGIEKRKLEDMVKQLGVSEHVTFPGFLADDDYALLYSLADVFAIASPAELQSIVTLEAAASGLPVIGVNAGALPELVQDGRNGFVFELGSSDELARRTIQLLKDDVLRRRMGRESRVIARRHDFNQTVREYERLYTEVTNGRAKELGFARQSRKTPDQRER